MFMARFLLICLAMTWPKTASNTVDCGSKLCQIRREKVPVCRVFVGCKFPCENDSSQCKIIRKFNSLCQTSYCWKKNETEEVTGDKDVYEEEKETVESSSEDKREKGGVKGDEADGDDYQEEPTIEKLENDESVNNYSETATINKLYREGRVSFVAEETDCGGGRKCEVHIEPARICITYFGNDCQFPCSITRCENKTSFNNRHCPRAYCHQPSPPSPPLPNYSWTILALLISSVIIAAVISVAAVAAFYIQQRFRRQNYEQLLDRRSTVRWRSRRESDNDGETIELDELRDSRSGACAILEISNPENKTGSAKGEKEKNKDRSEKGEEKKKEGEKEEKSPEKKKEGETEEKSAEKKKEKEKEQDKVKSEKKEGGAVKKRKSKTGRRSILFHNSSDEEEKNQSSATGFSNALFGALNKKNKNNIV